MIEYGLILMAFVAGCSGLNSVSIVPPEQPAKPKPDKVDHTTLAATLEENKLKWQANKATNYSFNFQRSCFCERDYTRKAVVQVAEGVIVAASYADDGTVVDMKLKDRYHTIEELFALLARAVAAGAAQIDVEFDTILGYPTSLYIDQDRRIGDDEQWIVASDVLLNS